MYPAAYPYQENQGLGLAPEWISGGFSTITSLIGGNQAKKQAERERDNLLLQQQMAQDEYNAAMELEQLKFQNLSAYNQINQSSMNPTEEKSNNNTGLIIGGVLLAVVGTAVAISLGRPKEKGLNGLLETIE